MSIGLVGRSPLGALCRTPLGAFGPCEVDNPSLGRVDVTIYSLDRSQDESINTSICRWQEGGFGGPLSGQLLFLTLLLPVHYTDVERINFWYRGRASGAIVHPIDMVLPDKFCGGGGVTRGENWVRPPFFDDGFSHRVYLYGVEVNMVDDWVICYANPGIDAEPTPLFPLGFIEGEECDAYNFDPVAFPPPP